MRVLLFGAMALVASLASQCQANLVWNIDSGNSYIRLNIPDQTVPINESGDTINAMLRDYQANGGPVQTGDPDVPAGWSDAGGRRSFVSGTLDTNYSEGSSIQFNGGLHAASAIEAGSYLPNPSGPAAFATDVWGNIEEDPDNFPGVITYSRLGHVRISNIDYDLDGTVSLAAGPPNTWTQSGGSIDLGTLAGALVDVDIPGLITQFGLALDPLSGVNIASMMVEDLGMNQRRLTIQVDVPVSLTLSGLPLTASITGQIVGLAEVPEPASIGLVGVALSLCAFRRRRARV